MNHNINKTTETTNTTYDAFQIQRLDGSPLSIEECFEMSPLLGLRILHGDGNHVIRIGSI